MTKHLLVGVASVVSASAAIGQTYDCLRKSAMPVRRNRCLHLASSLENTVREAIVSEMQPVAVQSPRDIGGLQLGTNMFSNVLKDRGFFPERRTHYFTFKCNSADGWVRD